MARLIGRYLYAHGVLPRDTFVERNALALKGGPWPDGGFWMIQTKQMWVKQCHKTPIWEWFIPIKMAMAGG